MVILSFMKNGSSSYSLSSELRWGEGNSLVWNEEGRKEGRHEEREKTNG